MQVSPAYKGTSIEALVLLMRRKNPRNLNAVNTMTVPTPTTQRIAAKCVVISAILLLDMCYYSRV